VSGGRFPGRVEEKRLVGSSVWLTVRIADWPGARPGQFALLQAEPSACFLARPLSVALEEEDRVSFLIAPIGAGTRELSGLVAGEELWVLGPLGNGFPLDLLLGSGGGRLVLVGGGVGVAPLPLLLRQFARTRGSVGGPAGAQEILVLLGFRDAAQAEAAGPVLEEVGLLRAAGVSCRCVTTAEDGSGGTPGLVTEALSAELLTGDRVAVCGPEAMAEAVWSVCSAVQGVRSWYSLETVMACGMGSCHGCVIPLADGSLARVCAEGPVFAGESVWGRDVGGSQGKVERR
jgi:dihydroorotate dehydrogenase electron transfer subunit